MKSYDDILIRVGMMYFRPEVLKHYTLSKDFEVRPGRDSSSRWKGKIVTLDTEYIQESGEYADIRYGWRQLVDGTSVVATTLYDITDKSKGQLSKWLPYEITDPDLTKEDEGFQNYCRETFDGDFLDY